MNRESFAAKIRKLASGFNHHLTPERLEAVWKMYGHNNEAVIDLAVTDLLLGDRYPGAKELAGAVARALESEQQDYLSAMHADDRAPWRPTWEESNSIPHARARFYTRLMRWFYSQPRWPEWSDVEEMCSRPGEMWEDPPSDWRDVVAACWRQNQPGTKSGSLAGSLPI